MADTNTRQGKRTPVTLKIKFKSETLEQFIERYAVDVSQGGIFIRTKDPLAVGTQMKFEFQLRDASPLIAGEGTVVWTRENDPSRPAIAPGMGVRFDRLADGSQTVLEKILAEKAKQAPSRSANQTAPGDSSKAGGFMDTPTRVAPAEMQEALGVRSGRHRSDSEQTPLPKPTPFHSDADDFDESAFAEATKIRSLDELALHSVGLDTGDDLMNDAGSATKIMPADELSVRRQAGRADSTIADPPLAAPPEEARRTHSMPDRDSAPGLPSPPAVEPARPRLDPTPPRPSNSSVPPMSTHGGGSGSPSPSASDPGQRTQPGLGGAKSMAPAASDSAVPRPVAAEPSLPIAPSRPSSAPVIIGILLVVAAAMGAVYWFVLRDPGANTEVVDNTPTPGSGSAIVTDPGSGSAAMTGSGSAVAMTGSGSAAATGSGSGVAMTGSGSAAVMPAAPTVDTVITASAKGATIEIVGTEMKGPSPFTAKLEKDKPYKARITAAGFTLSEIDVKGGERTTAKLVLKPRIVTVTTEPAGASIYVDNVDTGKVTPDSVTLSAAQAGRPRVRISLRRSGFRPVDTSIDASAFKDEGATMTNAVEAKLAVQQVVRPPTGGTGTGSGSAATPTGAGSGSAATPTPTPTPTPTGTGTGSAGTGTTGAGSGSAASKPPTTGTGSGTSDPLSSPKSGGGSPTDLK